jgi:putative membrane protein
MLSVRDMRLLHNAILALTIGLCIGAAVACSRSRAGSVNAPNQSSKPGHYADSSGNPNTMDRDFAWKAAQDETAAIQVGKLAIERGVTMQVKDYGRKLVDDHTSLKNQLIDIATREGILLPEGVSDAQRDTFASLSKLSGAQFDREFVKYAATDHRAELAAFLQEAGNGQDQTLMVFAANSVALLQDRLTLAEAIGTTLRP